MANFSSKVSRRTSLKLLAASAAFAPLGAPFISNARAATLELRGLIWETYNAKDMVAQFEADNKVKCSFTYFDGNAEAFNQFKAGGTRDFDMVQADGNWPQTYFRNGLIQAIDESKVPNLANCLPDFMPPKNLLHIDAKSGSRIAAPNCWGGMDIIYNKSKMSEEEASTMWVLFNEKFKGHLTTTARYEETIAWAGVVVAKKMGTDTGSRPDGKPFNPYVLTPQELSAVQQLLIEQKSLLLTRYQDLDMLTRLLRTQQIWAGPGATLAYAPLLYDYVAGKLDWEPGYALKMKEGSLAWIDTWMISSGVQDSEKLELVHKWINAFLTKENMAKIVKATGFASAVDCKELLTPLQIQATLQDQTQFIQGKYWYDTPSSPEQWEKVWSAVEAS
jgi:spermidine/putrescine-binding protein